MKVIRAVAKFLGMNKAEGWRYTGTAVVFFVFADAAGVSTLGQWVGISGVICLLTAQRFIEDRSPQQHITIKMSSAGDGYEIGRALAEHLDRTRGGRSS